MVIGGIAVIARGVRRFTTDIDAAVRGDEVDIPAVLRTLATQKIVPRIEDAAKFASESLVLLVRHAPTGVDLDVSLAWTPFEHQAISSATVAAFGSVDAPMAKPEDLVVFKAIAARGKDIDDITALLALYPLLDLEQIRARARQLAALAESPELSESVERALQALKPVRVSRATRSSPRPPKRKATGPKSKKPIAVGKTKATKKRVK